VRAYHCPRQSWGFNGCLDHVLTSARRGAAWLVDSVVGGPGPLLPERISVGFPRNKKHGRDKSTACVLTVVATRQKHPYSYRQQKAETTDTTATPTD